jgi:hypothetical protein
MTMVHNALDRATEISRGFRRALGMHDGGVERTSETLTPVFNLWGRLEHGFLRGEVPGWGWTEVAAGGVGIWSLIQLLNPVGSGRIVVCTHIVVMQQTRVNLLDDNTALTNVTAQGPADGRLAFSSVGLGLSGRVRHQTNASALGVSNYALPASGQYEIGAVLMEGDSIICDPRASNTTLWCGYRWYERVPLPGELRNA